MIRCLIIDDEVIAQQILEEYILTTPRLVLVAKCYNALEAFAKLEQHHIDLVFLDIEMPLINGLTFLKSLQHPPKVILTTAYSEHALTGFDLGVVDYLLKPFSFTRFTTAVERAEQLLDLPSATMPSDAEKPSLIVYEKNEGSCKILLSDILFIKASKDYMKITTINGQFTASLTMKKLEDQLPENQFVRTHKSYIVALAQIKFLRKDNLVLANQAYVPISISYREKVNQLFYQGAAHHKP